MGALLALSASLLWGASDFAGGTLTRRLPVYAVVGWSQAAGLLGVTVVAAALGDLGASPGYLSWAVAAGLVGVVAVAAFYRALAIGTMGVVAPVAALSVVVPVIVGVAEGDRPGPLQIAGLVVASAGAVLAGGPEIRAGASGARSLVLAGVAAVGFGAVIVLVAKGSETSVPMTLLAMRVVSAGLVAAVALTRRSAGLPGRQDLPWLAGIGVGDVAANACFAVASTKGLLALVGVLSSLYPAVTAVLAWRVHTEQLQRVQVIGVGSAVLGVVLIGTGGGTS